MNKYKEENYWKIIEDLNWGYYCMLYERNITNKKPYKVLREEIKKKYILSYEEISLFVKDKRRNLQNYLRNWRKKQTEQYDFGSDDGFWDVTTHVIGLGKNFYNFIIKNPYYISEMYRKNLYIENFEYSFNMKHEKDLNKYIKIAKRKQKLNKLNKL